MSLMQPDIGNRIRSYLATRPIALVVYAMLVAFSTYLCMYGFRKAYDVGEFRSLHFFGTHIELKTAFVVAQIIGYTLSKFLGSWICSSVRLDRRVYLLLGLVAVSELALIAFALLPRDLKPLAMLFNGLPLGMVWGLVVSYLEGRRVSEVLVVGLSCAYVVGGAIAKDVARDLVMGELGASEWWMPAVTGAVFAGPFVVAVWLLNCLPPPSEADVAARAVRSRMDWADRKRFLMRFGTGFLLLLLAYFFLTSFRDFRDHYGKEIIRTLNLDHMKGVFTKMDVWSALAVLGSLGLLNTIRTHRVALRAIYSLILSAYSMLGLMTLLYQYDIISGFVWLTAMGVCTYLAYVPYGALLFERMVAATRVTGTAVFAIQLADGVGYTGSVLTQLTRDQWFGGVSRLDFLIHLSYIVSIAGVALMSLSFWRLMKRVPR